MNYSTINFNIDADNIAWVRLDRSRQHHALDLQMMHELIEVFTYIAGNAQIRAVVLSASGNSFCAGADLQWMKENLDKPRGERIAESKVLADVFVAISQCPKLLIGRINGSAYGGGIGLMAVCDITIGLEKAHFALSEVNLGLVPANIAVYVLRKIGSASMRRIALNGYRFNGRMAHKLGLIDELVSDGELDHRVNREIKLAMAAAPIAIATTKNLLSTLDADQLSVPPSYAIEVLADAWEGNEARAGITAFFNKKAPPWKPKAG